MADVGQDEHDFSFAEGLFLVLGLELAVSLLHIVDFHAQVFVGAVALAGDEGDEAEDVGQTLALQSVDELLDDGPEVVVGLCHGFYGG